MSGIVLAVLRFIAGLIKDHNDAPTKANDADGTPLERGRFVRRVREWEASGAGGPGQNDPTGGTGHAGKGLL